MRVYISGQIGELEPSPSTIEKFAKAEEKLRARGFDVFNPISRDVYRSAKKIFNEVESPHLEEGACLPDIYSIILTMDIRHLSHCHAIYLLADYPNSPGARAEHAFARATKKNFFFQDTFHALTYLTYEYYDLVETGKPPLQREDGENDSDLCDRYVRMHLDEILIP